jgi:hypothetical protein
MMPAGYGITVTVEDGALSPYADSATTETTYVTPLVSPDAVHVREGAGVVQVLVEPPSFGVSVAV